MKAAGISVRAFEQETERAGMSLRKAGNHGFWFNQAMFTVRRTIYGVTLGLAALTAGAAAMGFMFQSTMEQNRLAFTRFLGSQEAADKELSTLFELAAKTPFEFTQVVDATRKFLAFGFSLEETNALLATTADAVAGFGLSAEAIDRAVLALGQMRSAGRVLGQDLRQLQELGLFSPEDFQRRLNLPEGFLGNVGNLMIPSKPAIDAITAYWRERFGGASADFATTFKGQLTTLRDYGSRTFGAMVEPLYKRLSKDVLPVMVLIATEGQKGFESGGFTGFFEAVDRTAGHGLNLAGAWGMMVRTGKALLGVVQPLATAFYFAYTTLRPTLILVGLLLTPLETFGSLLEALQWPLNILITLWVTERSVLFAVAIMQRRYLFGLIATRIATWGLIMAMRARAIWEWAIYLFQMRYLIVTAASIAMTTTWAGVLMLLTTWLRVAAIAMIRLTLVMLANPWIAAATAIVLLELKFHVLENTIKRIIHDVKVMIDWFKKVDNWGPEIDPGKWGQDFRGWVKHQIPGMATGGNVTRSGFALVGERGPEIAHFPSGASVAPLEGPSLFQGFGDAIRSAQGDIVIPITMELDGREMAKKTVRYRHKVAAVQ